MPNVAHSVRSRLLNLAREEGVEFQNLLRRFAAERLLHRIEKSRQSDVLVLKGAMLFSVWLDRPFRPTKDVDFLGVHEASVAEMERLFREMSKRKSKTTDSSSTLHPFAGKRFAKETPTRAFASSYPAHSLEPALGFK